MTREEAIEMLKALNMMLRSPDGKPISDSCEALDMAIEALQFAEHFDLLKEYQSLQEVVRCKDCRYANECHKSVQYTHNEQSTITIGYTPIEWCSRGECKGGDAE